MIRSTDSVSPYDWGEGAKGWRWCDTPGLSVIREEMPPGTAETRHRHAKAHQVFHALTGALTLEMEGTVHTLLPDTALNVPPGTAHQALNLGPEPCTFLVISAPSTRDDGEELA
ncbi:MAG: cupin domain-containing protein [Pseudomonadota bacterium]